VTRWCCWLRPVLAMRRRRCCWPTETSLLWTICEMFAWRHLVCEAYRHLSLAFSIGSCTKRLVAQPVSQLATNELLEPPSSRAPTYHSEPPSRTGVLEDALPAAALAKVEGGIFYFVFLQESGHEAGCVDDGNRRLAGCVALGGQSQKGR
jgi:hypothetical protein